MPSGSFDIAANDDEEFEIDFSPTALTHVAIILVRSTDPTDQTYTFAITGDGNGPELQMLGRNFPSNPNYLIENGQGPSSSSGGRYDVYLSETEDHYFTIRNEGTEELVITQPAIEGVPGNSSRPGFFSIQSLGSTTTIDAGEEHEFVIRCLANEAGNFAAKFTMQSNDLDEGDFEFSLSATVVVKPRIILGYFNGITWLEVQDLNGATGLPPIDFGSVPFGETSARSFRIRNPGTGVLEIDSAASSEPQFAFVGLPATVPAGSVSNFTIAFNSSGIGTYTRLLQINSNGRADTLLNDASTQQYTFRTTGQGSEPSEVPEIEVYNTSGVLIANGSSTTSPGLGNDFGSAASGYLQVTRSFVIANQGDGDLVVTDTTFPTGSAFSIDRSQLPITVGGTSLGLLQVKVVNRRVPGTYTSTMTLESNDLVTPSYTIPLTIELTEPLPGALDEFRIVGGQVEFAMKGSEGVRYRLESSPDLSTGSWQLQNGVAEWTLQGDQRDFTLPIPLNQERRFFRVVVVPFL